jgi:mRNA interferase MazF
MSPSPVKLPDLMRGEVVSVRLDGAEGYEKQNDADSGVRSCVVVQNNHGNSVSPLTVIVPLTGMDQAKGYPFQISISGSVLGPGGKDCIADCGHVRSIDKSRIIDRFRVLPDSLMKQIDGALRNILDLQCPPTGNVVRGLPGRPR